MIPACSSNWPFIMPLHKTADILKEIIGEIDFQKLRG